MNSPHPVTTIPRRIPIQLAFPYYMAMRISYIFIIIRPDIFSAGIEYGWR